MALGLIGWILVFGAALAVLIKSADLFTDSAEKLSLLFKVPAFIVAVTVVAIGTSLPELATSIAAVFSGATEIVVANAVGSNIANVLLVTGLAAVVAGQLKSKRSLIDLDLPVMGIITVVMLMVIWDMQVTFGEGLLSVLGYALYLFYVAVYREKHLSEEEEKEAKKQVKEDQLLDEPKSKIARDTIKAVVWLVVSGVGIYFGAHYTVISVLEIADMLSIATSVITLAAVALGTSLPEVVVSVAAAYKKQYEIALGNVVGSNIFNALMVVGMPALFSPLAVDDITMSIGLRFLVGATVIYTISGISQRIHRLEGLMYVLLYLFFLGGLFAIL